MRAAYIFAQEEEEQLNYKAESEKRNREAVSSL